MLELATAPSHDEPIGGQEPGAQRFDPFRALSDAERAEEIVAYHGHLLEREGEIDWETWTLPKREEQMRELRARQIVWKGRIDRDAFYQHFHRVGRPETDIRTHWAILAGISNESERYGVVLETRQLKRKGAQADPVQVYHVLQEDYHTAMLLEACRTLGLDGVRLLRPRRVHQWIIRAMTYMPDSLRYGLILVGESIGSVVTKLLRDTCHLFGDDPKVEEHLRAILTEIIDDERLHAVHCRARVGRWALPIARAVLPLATWVAVRAYPQIGRLGLDHRKLAEEIRRGVELPADVDWVKGGAAAGSPA